MMEAEVICISSDDEPDSRKENIESTYLANTVIINNSSVVTKVETSSNDNDRVEENTIKRKINKVGNSTAYNNIRKKKKLNLNQDIPRMTEKNGFITSGCILQPNEDKIAIKKPKLILKERKSVSYVAHDIFPLFISLCLQKSHDNDMKKIVDKLKRRYDELDPVYASSKKFVSFLNEKREAIMHNNMKLYVHIGEVMTEMKRNIRKKSHVLSNNQVHDAIPSTSYATDNLSVNNEKGSDCEDDEDVDHLKSPHTRNKIKQLSKAMRKCELMIKKLEEAEVDFEDEEDSNYIKTERYKRRMIELYNKYCELTGGNADAGRAYLRPKHISTTRIVVVDQAITNFINTKISRRNQIKTSGAFTDDLIFPDYRDILQCVSRCNEKKNLGLDKKRQEQMAKEAFVELGEYLQRARRNDYWDTFSLYLENKEEDPAVKDNELAKKLRNNRKEGEKRLTAVFEKYTRKQEALKDQAINGNTTSEEEGEEEEESSLDNDNENNDNLFADSLSDEDNDSEENMDEITKENRSLVDKIKDNINTKNVNQDIHKVITNETETGAQQGKCSQERKIKYPTKENDAGLPESSNWSITENITCNTDISSITVSTKNIVQTEIQAQKSSLPFSSTTDYANTSNRIEEDVGEVVTEHVAEVVTDGIAKVVTDGIAKVVTDGLAEILTEDVAEVITGNITKVITDKAEVVTKNVTEAVTEDIAEIITEDVGTEVLLDDKQPEEGKKPLLRVRSFAKPPTTWEDGRHKGDKISQDNVIEVANKDVVVDLANEGGKSMPPVTKYAIQVGNKVIPLVKANRQTLVIPSANVISVQNITNNYLKVNSRTGQIIAPVRDIGGSTVIRMPTTQTSTQVQPQDANVTATGNELPIRRNETILRIIQPSKTIIVPKKLTRHTVSKQIDLRSAITKPK